MYAIHAGVTPIYAIHAKFTPFTPGVTPSYWAEQALVLEVDVIFRYFSGKIIILLYSYIHKRVVPQVMVNKECNAIHCHPVQLHLLF